MEPIKKDPSLNESSQLAKQSVPEENLAVNDYDIDAFLAKRKEFITKVNAIMVDGKDYHVIQGKKSLAKGGAEKIASIFGWTASFEKDTASMDAFSDLKGTIVFVCNLAKGQVILGQGRGAASLGKNAGDLNKTLKMAQKSAFIDAILRASGLSDFFTQDLEDMPTDTVKPKAQDPYEGAPKAVRPISQKQALFIKSLRSQKQQEKISDEDLRKMTSEDASKEIERLQKLEDELPIITIE